MKSDAMRTAARALLVASLPMISAGCATSTGTPPPEVSLPAAPGYMMPVKAPEIREGDDAFVVLAEHRAALGKANSRLRASRRWYEQVRARYGEGGK